MDAASKCHISTICRNMVWLICLVTSLLVASACSKPTPSSQTIFEEELQRSDLYTYEFGVPELLSSSLSNADWISASRDISSPSSVDDDVFFGERAVQKTTGGGNDVDTDNLRTLVVQMAESILNDFNYRTEIVAASMAAATGLTPSLTPSSFNGDKDLSTLEIWPSNVASSTFGLFSSVAADDNLLTTPELPSDVSDYLMVSANAVDDGAGRRSKTSGQVSKQFLTSLVTAFRPSDVRLTSTSMSITPSMTNSKWLTYKSNSLLASLYSRVIRSSAVVRSPLLPTSTVNRPLYSSSVVHRSAAIHSSYAVPLQRPISSSPVLELKRRPAATSTFAVFQRPRPSSTSVAAVVGHQTVINHSFPTNSPVFQLPYADHESPVAELLQRPISSSLTELKLRTEASSVSASSRVTSSPSTAATAVNVPDLYKLNELDLVRNNASNDDTVDKIIEGLMNIIRPMKNDTMSKLPSPPPPPPLVIPTIPEDDQQKPILIPARLPPTTFVTIKPSSLNGGPPIDDEISDKPAQLIGLYDFPEAFIQNSNSWSSVTTSSSKKPPPPSTTLRRTTKRTTTTSFLRPHVPPSPSPSVTLIFKDHVVETRPVVVPAPPPPLLSTSTNRLNVTTSTEKYVTSQRPYIRPTLLRPTKKPTSPPKPDFVSFGLAKPILLNSLSTTTATTKRPVTVGANSLISQESFVGSNLLKLKVTSTYTRPPPPIIALRPSTSSVERPTPDQIPMLLRPLVGSENVKPSVASVPIRIVPSPLPLPPLVIDEDTLVEVEDVTEPILMDHFSSHTSSNVFSTHSTVLISPTSSSSSIVRQTIFQTVVSISSDDLHPPSSAENVDEFHVEQHHEAPADVFHGGASSDDLDLSFSVVAADEPLTIQPITTTTTTTTTTRKPATRKPTTRPTTTTTSNPTTTTTSKPTTPTTSKPTTLRTPTITTTTTTKPKRPTRRTTTRRPFFKNSARPATSTSKPQSLLNIAVADSTSTKKPQQAKPQHSLMSFGLSLLPAAVLATFLGIPLALAVGKKRRKREASTGVFGTDVNGLLSGEEWLDTQERIAELVRRKFK